jgi:hypothetical protein
MANQITPLSYANTFGDWVVTTNKVLAETNDLQANNYTKDSGTLLINSTGTGIQVANNALVQGQLSVSGTGSSVIVQNNLTVTLGTIQTSNTTGLGLLVNGIANIANLQITGTGLNNNNLNPSLYVANTTLLNGNTTLANNLVVGGNTRVANLISNTWVQTQTLYTLAGYTQNLTANIEINAGWANVAGAINANFISANSYVNTATLYTSSNAYVMSLNSNSYVTTSNVYSLTANVNSLSANVFVNTRIVYADTANIKGITANSYVNTGILYANTVNSTTLSANSSITSLGTLNVAGAAVLASQLNVDQYQPIRMLTPVSYTPTP